MHTGIMESSSVLNCINVEKKNQNLFGNISLSWFYVYVLGGKKPPMLRIKPVLLYTKAISKVHKVFHLHLWLVSKIPGICWNHWNTGVHWMVHVLHFFKNKFENCRHSWSYIEAWVNLHFHLHSTLI